jgi:hypothetical protein
MKRVMNLKFDFIKNKGVQFDFLLNRLEMSKYGGKKIFSPQYVNRKREVKEISLFLQEFEVLKVLDYGCGSAPYKSLEPNKWIGVDIEKGTNVDCVIPEHSFPKNNINYSHFLCTTALEHMSNIELFLKNFEEAVPHGTYCLFIVPFIVHEHGPPTDYQRLTEFGVIELFKKYQILQTQRLYGVGFCISHFINIQIDSLLRKKLIGHGLRLFLFPFWYFLFSLSNLTGKIVDFLLGENSKTLIYNSVLIKFIKI